MTNISKATVNPYYGREIPDSEALGLDPDKVYNLYRDPAELAKGAASFARLQLLDTHVPVDATDVQREHWVGSLGSDVRFEHPYLKTSLTVHDQRAIDAILAKQTAQLSSSYRYRADMTPGVSPDGVEYDGVMRDIIGNHVALVREGRAGPDVFVNDHQPIGLSKMAYKFPAILAALSTVLALDEAQKTKIDLALDKAKDEDMPEAYDEDREAAMDAREEACDAREEAMDEMEKDEVARGDRKKARDARKAARDARAADRKMGKDKAKDKAKDSDEPEPKKDDKASDSVSKSELDLAVKRASDEAVARVEAREQAKRDVAALVGPITVAMDSAEAVYRFALDQVKVAHKGVHASALPAIVSAEIRARKGATVALDAAPQSEHTIDSIFGRK